MFRLPAIFFAVLLTCPGLYAQRNISGRVIDVKSGEPLAGASVFISNTSKGTVSDASGAFSLTDLPLGQQELVISSIGYATNVYSFSAESLPLKVKVEMQVKVRELENVTVEPSFIEGWDKWGSVFTENFIGLTPNASKCRIKNYKSIRFRYFRKTNRVIAWSDEPLVIENKALGYTLRYQLENFEVKFSENITTFSGYPFFEDHHTEGAKMKNRWREAREKAYTGSMMQFMRSLYHNTLAADGFEVRRMKRRPNYEKQRVKEIYHPAQLTGTVRIQVGVKPGGSRVILPPDPNAVDSSEYYNRVLQEEDVIDSYYLGILTAENLIIQKEGAYQVLWFEDYLYVTCLKEKEDPSYLDYHWERRAPTWQSSHIWLSSGTPIVIDANGSYSPPQEVFSQSYWSWSEKIAELLPIDYK